MKSFFANGFNAIGDVAGRFKTYKALERKMPNSQMVALGDLVDRGPNPFDLIKYMMDQGHLLAMGNHEHIFLCAVNELIYPDDEQWKCYHDTFSYWTSNNIGGFHTFKDFCEHTKSVTDFDKYKDRLIEIYYQHTEMFNWLEQSPLFYSVNLLNVEGRTAFLSHAPWPAPRQPTAKKNYFKNLSERQLMKKSSLWTRGPFEEWEGVCQITGHNSYWEKKEFRNRQQELYGLCVDYSNENKLVGIHWPSMKIYEQETID